MLDGENLTGFGEVEHIEDDGLGAAVLAPMDRAYYFYQSLALMERTFVAVSADDGQITLLYDAVVDGRMVMPACNGSYGKRHTQYRQLRLAFRKVRQLHAIPTLRCAG